VPTCQNYDSNCHWYKPWICAEAGACWIAYGFEYAALEAAELAVEAAKALVDDVGFVVLEGAVSGAQSVVDEAGKVLEDMEYPFNAIPPSPPSSPRSLLPISLYPSLIT
jgi:hypothetical protein